MLLELTEEGRKIFEAHGLTGALFTDSVLLADCPKCGAKKGHYCVSLGGRRKWPPHQQRIVSVPVDDLSVYKNNVMSAQSFQEILMERMNNE